MGLTIYYQGRFKQKASLPAMIEEVREFAQIYRWNYNVFERDFKKILPDEPHDSLLYGIEIYPAESEPVSFTFLSNRRMSSALLLMLWGNDTPENQEKYLYSLFTKTQFAGKQIHMLIVDLFRHISRKYISHFRMTDEGKYWETGDEKVLEVQFNRYNYLLDMFSDGVKNIPPEKGQNIEDHIKNIAENIHKDYRNRKF